MTWKRYLTVAFTFALFIGIGLAAALVIPEGPGVTKTNYDRINYEMTLAEVEAIFGRPSDFTDAFGSMYVWRFSEGNGVVLWISETEGVYRKHWPEDAETETIIQKIRRWMTAPKSTTQN